LIQNIDFLAVISFLAVLLSTCLGLYALLVRRSSLPGRIFAVGMFLLAAEQVFSALGQAPASITDLLKYAHLRMLAGALIPCVWMVFSACFAREEPRASLAKWKYVYIAFALVPISLVIFASDLLFSRIALPHHEWLLVFGWPSFVYYSIVLSGAIVVLVNLEKTLRASSGQTRWQIKFMLLGIGSLFAARIYTSSERILFLGDNPMLCAINSGMLLFADILVIVAALRTRLRHYSVYISQDLLYNSAVIVIVGIYLFGLGVLAKIARYFGAGEMLLQNAFLIFIALVGVSVLLLSGNLQFRTKKFISRHFKRPLYDYKKILGTLAERTISLVNMQDFCSAVAKNIAETVNVPTVSIWLNDETQKSPVLAGSTHLPLSQDVGPDLENEIKILMISLHNKQEPIKLDSPFNPEQTPETLPRNNQKIHCCVPLAASGELLGIITLGRKQADEDFTLEDFDLLKIIGNYAAGFALNHRLFEDLSMAREMEAFQRLSTFFVHDMKNLASTLSLTLENLPLHYNNPKYREGATKIISGSLQKIQDMCSRLSSLKHKPLLNFRDCDLNAIVTSAISNFQNSPDIQLIPELNQIPPVRVDSDEIEKVLLNLILNAKEASGASCRIRITTVSEDGYGVLSVADDGKGMSQEYLARSLFKPFKSTKTKGLGIGLYQSKMVIDAHKGKMEVESEEGIGTTFRIFVPLAG